MKKLLFCATAAAVMSLMTVSSSEARDYPFCAAGRGVGNPGDCMYSSYRQCMASASGRGLYCIQNPRAAYGWSDERPRQRRR